MDNAVALVQTYLQVNGYFTVAEYPVIESFEGGYRALTDIDILAFRFPTAGRLIPGAGGEKAAARFEPDPRLGIPAEDADLMIGEIKEGRAELNKAGTDPSVLRVALRRFGCCDHKEVDHAVEKLIQTGQAELCSGYRVRLVAFGTLPPENSNPAFQVIYLSQVMEFLNDYIGQHWEVLKHAQFKDQGLGLLLTMEKARRGTSS